MTVILLPEFSHVYRRTSGETAPAIFDGPSYLSRHAWFLSQAFALCSSPPRSARRSVNRTYPIAVFKDVAGTERISKQCVTRARWPPLRASKRLEGPLLSPNYPGAWNTADERGLRELKVFCCAQVVMLGLVCFMCPGKL